MKQELLEKQECMVSVIMSCYKEPEAVLRESIESILHQTYTNIEFIIISDNPENKLHQDIIEAYCQLDSRIVYRVQAENRGLSQSLNEGIAMARGAYICRMDADDIAHVERIRWQKDYLEAGEYDLIGGLVTVINENGEELYRVKKLPSKPQQINKRLRYNQCIPHPCWFGKKSVFEKLEGYRELTPCEDYDFTLRAALQGYRISNLNKEILKYRVVDDGISRSNLYEQYLRAKYLTKCYKKKNIAEIAELESYVDRYNKEKVRKRYLRASYLFDETVKNLQKKRYGKFFVKGIQLSFCSLTYLDKIYRYARASIGCK